jgi:integrase/recombinase XerD
MPKPPPKNTYRRNGILWARFKVRGKVHRESLHTRDEGVARKRLKLLREQVENQIIYGDRAPVLWEAAVVRWAESIRRLKIRPATAKRYAVSIKQLEDWLLGVEIQRIDADLIKRIIRDRSRRGATNATIRRDLSAISSVLGVAVDEGWLDTNVARAIDRSRIRESRDPIELPTAASLNLMYKVKSRFMDMAEFAAETGMRQEEIRLLRHDQVDAGRMAAQLVETKSGHARSVPLSTRAVEIIERQPPFLRSPFIFWRGEGKPFKNVSAQFYATAKRVARKASQAQAPFRVFRFHDLRHLYAVTYLREQRGTIYDLQQVLGHSSVKTTEIYLNHLTPEERRHALYGGTQSGTQDERFAQQEGGKNG